MPEYEFECPEHPAPDPQWCGTCATGGCHIHVGVRRSEWFSFSDVDSGRRDCEAPVCEVEAGGSPCGRKMHVVLSVPQGAQPYTRNGFPEYDPPSGRTFHDAAERKRYLQERKEFWKKQGHGYHEVNA